MGTMAMPLHHMLLGVTLFMSAMGMATSAMLPGEGGDGARLGDRPPGADTTTASAISVTETTDDAGPTVVETRALESGKGLDGSDTPRTETERSVAEELERIEARQGALIETIRSMLEP